MAQRQQVLALYLVGPDLNSGVIAWSFWDGTGKGEKIDPENPPFKSGIDALLAGWRVIQFPQLLPPYPGTELTTSYLKYEFIFEKLQEV
jgi:hypothetical protein